MAFEYYQGQMDDFYGITGDENYCQHCEKEIPVGRTYCSWACFKADMRWIIKICSFMKWTQEGLAAKPNTYLRLNVWNMDTMYQCP